MILLNVYWVKLVVVGLNRDEVPISEFRDACKGFNKEYIKLQTDGFKRLGVLADWKHP